MTWHRPQRRNTDNYNNHNNWTSVTATAKTPTTTQHHYQLINMLCLQYATLYRFTSANPKHTLLSHVVLRLLLSLSLSCPLAAPVMHPDSLLRLWCYVNLLLTYLSYQYKGSCIKHHQTDTQVYYTSLLLLSLMKTQETHQLVQPVVQGLGWLQDLQEHCWCTADWTCTEAAVGCLLASATWHPSLAHWHCLTPQTHRSGLHTGLVLCTRKTFCQNSVSAIAISLK